MECVGERHCGLGIEMAQVDEGPGAPAIMSHVEGDIDEGVVVARATGRHVGIRRRREDRSRRPTVPWDGRGYRKRDPCLTCVMRRVELSTRGAGRRRKAGERVPE